MAHLHSRFKSLVSAIKGVIFFGTPHRGAGIATWSSIFGRIANVALLGSIRTDLLKDLQPRSEMLVRVASDFVEVGASLIIFSIYERKFISPFKSLVVDKESAILNIPNETAIPIEADHQSMCRFLTANSDQYMSIFDTLSEL